MNKISKNGLKMIRQFEGERLRVYRDVAGLPTVGVGHLVRKSDDLAVGDTITKEQSEAFLAEDIKTFEESVNQIVKVPLTQNEFDAVVSLCYNIGRGALASSRSLRLLNAGNKARFADAILSFNKARVKGQLRVVQGLVNRREAERKVFLTGYGK